MAATRAPDGGEPPGARRRFACRPGRARAAGPDLVGRPPGRRSTHLTAHHHPAAVPPRGPLIACRRPSPPREAATPRAAAVDNRHLQGATFFKIAIHMPRPVPCLAQLTPPIASVSTIANLLASSSTPSSPPRLIASAWRPQPPNQNLELTSSHSTITSPSTSTTVRLGKAHSIIPDLVAAPRRGSPSPP